MGEEPELPTSTMYFEGFNFRHFEADEMAMSPPQYDTNVLITLRKPSFSGNKTENSTVATAAKDDVVMPLTDRTTTKRFSHLLPAVYRSLENLSLIPRDAKDEKQNNFTRSLPPSPMTSPDATPQGSPKTSRHELAEISENESWNSQLWFYPGILSSVIAREVGSVGTTMDKTESRTNSSNSKQLQPTTSLPSTPNFAISRNVRKKTTCFLSNRDLNFLSPTSM